MPECALENLGGRWPSSESLNASAGSVSSGFHSPGSPTSFSPISTSPESTLKRPQRVLRRTSSSEPFVIRSDHRDARSSRSQSPLSIGAVDDEEEDASIDEASSSLWISLIGWYPLFLLQVARAIIGSLLPATWRQLVLAVPMLWLSMWAWCFWQLVQLPLAAAKCTLGMLLSSGTSTSSSAMRGARLKRTVLISGGSSVQALHLARNFHAAGARVVVCEVRGLFALARFSTAVARFYSVPRPTGTQQQHYVRALCDIVAREAAAYYIPVSAATPAYFDAVAKPHLELLGCTCFAPGIKEVRALDDLLEVFKRCERAGIATPPHHALTSRDAVDMLYHSGVVRPGGRPVHAYLAGAGGIRERSTVTLQELRLPRQQQQLLSDVSEQRPWVAVPDVEGEHFITCTTVKESKVVANVTCRTHDVEKGDDEEEERLVPVENAAITTWLEHFFTQLHLLRPITGHVSFRLAVCARSGRVLPLNARVGVGLPYVCYTSVHPRLLWRPCRHFRRQQSGETQPPPQRHLAAVDDVTRLVGTVLDKREALFTVWDPLPYCAYYHMQLPFRNFVGFIRRTQRAFPTPTMTTMAAAVN